MKHRRSFRLPILLEQVLIGLIVTGVAWMVSTLWTRYSSWSERTLTLIGAGAALGILSVAFARVRAENIVVASAIPEYDRRLTRLAQRHRGTIKWFTRTSVWADIGANSERLSAKIEGVRKNRIKSAKYIIHLGYWAHFVDEDLAEGRAGAKNLYLRQIRNLLDNVGDFAKCPPEKVVIVVGELTEPGPPHRFGLYQSGGRTLLVYGYDGPMGQQTLPRLFVRGQIELIEYYENEFDRYWDDYTAKVEASPFFDRTLPYFEAVRNEFIRLLKAEYERVAVLEVAPPGIAASIDRARLA